MPNNSSSRYCGLVGFVKNVETARGLFSEVVEARKYYGDISSEGNRYEYKDMSVNNSTYPTMTLAIVADKYAVENYRHIVYAEVDGMKMKVITASHARPYVTLTLGGVYNG